MVKLYCTEEAKTRIFVLIITSTTKLADSRTINTKSTQISYEKDRFSRNAHSSISP